MIVYWGDIMFHNLSIKEVFDKLQSSINGLSSNEAYKRLEKNGKNELTEKRKKSNFLIFLSEFNDPMIIILIIASIISFIVSIIDKTSFTDSIIIIAIVIINAIMGYVQEKKADKAIESLKKMQTTTVKVRRNGKNALINSKDIVIGDVLVLEAGDKVPADARIISLSALKVDESALTGESIPVEKTIKKLKEDILLSNRSNMIYSGTSIVYGHCEAVVCATGMDTEFGKIASLLDNDELEVTPLQKKVEEISKILSLLILIVIGIIFFIGLYKNLPFLEILMLSLSLAVAAIPEGLPAVITITLSLGMSSMAKRKAIIRKMSSVETLGCTEIICSDKTGTITQNLMTVEKIYFNGKLYNSKDLCDDFFENMMILNNDASLSDDCFLGDPTEIALINCAQKGGKDIDEIRGEYVRLSDIPFDSNRKMMSTINHYDKGNIMITKGSFDSVISKCNRVFLNNRCVKLTEKIKNELMKVEDDLSSKSYRILAFAYKDDLKSKLEDNLVFYGLVCMIDPPREDVQKSIELCKLSNIKPIMITGDSLGIGIAIAKKIGILKSKDEAILGSELEGLSDEELKELVPKYSVYARVTPEEKLKIVNAWKANNKVVAMTGDGVNDAPAIKKADIGIGMGITGTEVSKNVSDVILADDSFSTIVQAVKEGRRIYDNIRNVLVYLLAGNIAEIIIVFVGIIYGFEIFLPIQLLYINLATDSLPAIALAFEDATEDIMSRKIRKKDSNFFTPFLIAKIAISALLKTFAILLIYFVNKSLFDVNVACTMAFFSLVFIEMFYAYSCRNLKKNMFINKLFANNTLNKSMLVLMLMNLVVAFTPVKTIFHLVDISILQFLYAIIISVLVLFIDELSKKLIDHIFNDY